MKIIEDKNKIVSRYFVSFLPLNVLISDLINELAFVKNFVRFFVFSKNHIEVCN